MRIKGEPTVWTGDPTFDLIAATYRQALADAKRGDLSAIQWLDAVAPDWQRLDKRKARKPYRVGALYKRKSADHAHGIKKVYKHYTKVKRVQS